MQERCLINGEESYLEALQNIRNNGKIKENRTGTDTQFLPNIIIEHDMELGFPILTTKKVAWKTLKVELEGFIGGITDKNWFEDRQCKIWSDWCNPQVVPYGHDEETQRRMKIESDLGPIYGYQWRRFGRTYTDTYSITEKLSPLYDDLSDQLATIVRTLRTNPDDRRMVCSAWNPNQLNQMSLPPCHFSWNLTHCDGILNLCWTQRSCDMFLGVPFNLASYGLLLHLLCSIYGFTPGRLTGVLMDAHIYQNHFEKINEQIDRTPTELPTIQTVDVDTIFDWDHTKTSLINYNPQSSIKADIAV